MLQAGVILSDYATLMVEILKDNARLEARAVYDAIDMPWASWWGRSRKPTAHRRCPAETCGRLNASLRDRGIVPRRNTFLSEG
jgi:hypothetical protein